MSNMDEKVKETTLERSSKITTIRRDGNSTRLVDVAIQILFEGKICVVMDHHEMGRNDNANIYLMHKIVKRLKNEHEWVGFDIVRNNGLYEITLKPYNE